MRGFGVDSRETTGGGFPHKTRLAGFIPPNSHLAHLLLYPRSNYVSDVGFSCCAVFEGLQILHGDYPLEGGLVPRSSAILVPGERTGVALKRAYIVSFFVSRKRALFTTASAPVLLL